MTDLQYLVIPPDGPPEQRFGPLTYRTIADTVGGDVEPVNLGPDATMYTCDDESGLSENPAASTLAGDTIMGTVLVAGPLGEGGTLTSLSDTTLQRLSSGL